MKKEPQKDKYSGKLKELSPTDIRHKVEEIQRQQRIRKRQEKKWDWLYDK